ncbi:BMP family ABC transporter substrate-binding protein [Mycoplasma sp. E35C]|uniref:BMP family ABC transporter substrate-binding protein n=1 Tax=Mycoplasma sp. E35C TaxID=2801918 RepID=UPI001CA3881F|nr:BMP family ABC transporter substrate-binding protein [Mycoplasma sp. E35C]QZX49028.1 BMP family protein [Mycoplasma sp. E35C]
MKSKSRAKKITKSIGLAGALSIVSATLASCGSSLAFQSSVQLVVSDAGSTLADQSFSESTFNGIRKFFSDKGYSVPEASDNSISENNGLWKRPGKSDQDRINSYRQIMTDGSQVAVATGFNQDNALNTILKDEILYNEFKNFGFIFVDGLIESAENGTNISSVTFETESAAFLTGIASGVLLNKHKDWYHTVKVDEKDTFGISGYVGLALPSTTNFLNGFRLGAIFFNEYIQPRIKDAKKLSWIVSDDSNKGSRDTLVPDVSGSFKDTEQRARTITDTLIDNGASLIYPVAGPQTSLTQASILAKKDKHVQIIGVDTAQEDLSSTERLEGAPGNKTIAFSTVKALDTAVYSVLKAIETGKEFNGFYGYGWNNWATLSNGGVSLSNPGLEYLPDLNDLFTQTKEGSEEQPKEQQGSKMTEDKQTEASTETAPADKGLNVKYGTSSKTIEIANLKTAKEEASRKSIIEQYIQILAGKSPFFAEENEKTRWHIKGTELYTFATKVNGDAKLIPLLKPANATDEDLQQWSHASAIFKDGKSYKKAKGELLNQSTLPFEFKRA